MQELFLGLLERQERESILTVAELAKNTQNSSGLPCFQGPALGLAQVSSDAQLPQDFGDINLWFGFKCVSVHEAKRNGRA